MWNRLYVDLLHGLKVKASYHVCWIILRREFFSRRKFFKRNNKEWATEKEAKFNAPMLYVMDKVDEEYRIESDEYDYSKSKSAPIWDNMEKLELTEIPN